MRDSRESGRGVAAWLLAGVLPVALVALWPGQADGIDPRVAAAEKSRVALIEKVSPSVVCVMRRGPGGLAGHGSGVLIDEDGYALTNFHVTSSAGGPAMKCGLPDGQLYDAVLVGDDRVGDVALIKLLPKRPGEKFPFARMGDSDAVKAGDWSLAMGNPFGLSTDFTPTVTFGLISGVHRYQYPEAGALLEYTDCIQFDTSINPGNSGGPLFNMAGELIGINGRGSFERRSRINSGVGYAISINQIKHFIGPDGLTGQLRAGMAADHASLGAAMETETEDEGRLSRILVKSILDSCDAHRRGLEAGDQLVSFVGRGMSSVNQFKNVLGLFPKGWRVPLSFRRENTQRREILVRLMGVQRQEIGGAGPGAGPAPKIVRPPAGGAAGKLFKAKAGFANYYFNEQAQKGLWTAFRKHGNFTALTNDWSMPGKLVQYPGGDRPMERTASFVVKERGGADGKTVRLVGDINDVRFGLEPLSPSERADAFKLPTDSGGFLLALYHYRQLLAFGAKGFVGEFSHGGIEPIYPPPPPDAKEAGPKDRPDYIKRRVWAEVFLTKHAGIPAKWYFATSDDPGKRWSKGQLIAYEVWAEREDDPCEVYLSDYREYKAGTGRALPFRMDIWRGDKRYAVFQVNGYDLN